MYLPGLRPGSMSWSIYRDFAIGLQTVGVDLRLLTDAPEEPAASDAVTYLPIHQGGWLDGLAAPFTRNRRFISTARRLAEFLRRNADLELLYSEIAYPWGAAAAWARRMAGWPGALVVTPMGEDFLVVPDASYGFGRFPLPRRALTRTLRAADGIRFISSLAAEHLAEHTDRPTAIVPLNVAPETLDASRIDEPTRAEQRRVARARLLADTRLGSRRLVLSLGRVHPFKGIHVLVDAMSEIPDADLVIVGPALSVAGYGDYGEYLRLRAHELGLDERVHLAGGVPHQEVMRWMSAADVLVVPSHLESMNRVCVEAAAAGTPFVVTETTGVSGYLDRPGVGVTIPPRDPAALAAAVRPILAGNWHRDAVAARSFIARFDMASIAPALGDLFARALSRRRGNG